MLQGEICGDHGPARSAKNSEYDRGDIGMTFQFDEDERPYLMRGVNAPWYAPRNLSDAERARFRAISATSRAAKAKAVAGDCDAPKYPIPTPRLDPLDLMPQRDPVNLSALSLFSGGGGLDIGFDRAGYRHVASYDILSHSGEVLSEARPDWSVFSGADGDVTAVQWAQYRNKVDVLHGGPPCQPFSHAGRQRGASDARDMVPELVRAVLAVKPKAFVLENVAGLASKKFESYVQETIFEPLASKYWIKKFTLQAADFGVPQRRRRIFFVGFAKKKWADAFSPPVPTHSLIEVEGLARTFGARGALGLPDIGFDDIAPTIRSGLTGPRHTTSVVNSATSAKHWAALRIWPNGVAKDRVSASAFPAKNGDYRMSVADCMILQGFPTTWPISGGAVYRSLGLIGNSVAPPMGYVVANAIADALRD